MDKPDFWNNTKRYYDLKSYWRNLFGCTVYKLSIDAGFTCPNRDGSIATGGCIYCDGRGSPLRQAGELPGISRQIASGKQYYKSSASKFIAYFQTFTNTYAPVDRLKALYDEALSVKDVIGMSVGTRPDCLGADVIDLLAGYAQKYHVWVELGLQSAHDETLARLNRGHNYAQFLDAVAALAQRGLHICVHIIIGLPGETPLHVHETAARLAALPVDGIKIHSLLALSGTQLGASYGNNDIELISKEKYVSLACDVLELLPPSMVIQRLTADGYRDIFLGPDWAKNKLDVLNAINRELEARNSFQGMRRLQAQAAAPQKPACRLN